MRSKLVAIFLIGWLVLSGICIAALFVFAFPQTRLVEIGRIEDFPPADTPYEIFEPVHVYVVNDGSQVIVIDPHIQDPNHYTANWNERERKFIDPQSGAWYNLTGRFTRGPTSSNLPRYPVEIKNGRVMIQLPRITREAVAHE